MSSPRAIPILLLLTALTAPAQHVPAPPPKATSNDFRISGTVSNVIDSQPLAGVEVAIAATEQRDETRQVVTGPDGRFVFENLAGGKYSLTAQRRGFSLQAFQQHDQYSTAIAVGPDLVSEGLVFSLTPDSSISGLVLDEENEPVRSGEVMLFNRSTDGGPGAVHLAARNSIDEQGHYRFGHLRAGTYFVVVSAQPWYAQDSPTLTGLEETPGISSNDPSVDGSPVATPPDRSLSPLDVVYPITYYPNATEPGNTTPIQLHPGEHATADVNLRAVPALHLRVVNASSDPSLPLTALVEQRVFDIPTQISLRNQQAANSTIVLTGVPPGHLVLSIRHFTGNDWNSLNKEIDVSSDAEIDAAEDSVGTVDIHGVIRRPGAAPFAAGTYIRFSNRESGETFGTQVNDKGEFDVQQAMTGPASYSVAVFNVSNLLVQGLSATGAQVAGHTVLFPRTGPVQIGVTMSEGSGRVDGVVVRDDKPTAETMVLLIPEHPAEESALFRRDQSDSDGTFTLRAILPGRYTVVAIEKGWELDWQNPAVLKPYLEHGEILDVAANKTYRVSVRAQPLGASIMGTSSALQ